MILTKNINNVIELIYVLNRYRTNMAPILNHSWLAKINNVITKVIIEIVTEKADDITILL